MQKSAMRKILANSSAQFGGRIKKKFQKAREYIEASFEKMLSSRKRNSKIEQFQGGIQYWRSSKTNFK